MKFWEKQNNQTIKCLACVHGCQLSKGQAGICGVRKNIGSSLELLVYGRPCSVNVDPIEKKPLYHFLPGTSVLSLGTIGCNFRCAFCQNWQISQANKMNNEQLATNNKQGTMNNGQRIINSFEYISPEKIVELAIENDCASIAHTYNEPTIWLEYALDIMKLARAKGLKNVFVSNGYQSAKSAKYLSCYLDAINIDLKSFNNEFYLKTCGAKLQPVLDNIARFYQAGVWLEITTLLIPGENDSDDELTKLAEFIVQLDKEIPWHLSAFHGDYLMAGKQATTYEQLSRAKEIGRQAGLKYIYLGNILTSQDANTYCPVCGELLIERDNFSACPVGLSITGQCQHCQSALAGKY